jgi:transcriptional activator SPT8
MEDVGDADGDEGDAEGEDDGEGDEDGEGENDEEEDEDQEELESPSQQRLQARIPGRTIPSPRPLTNGVGSDTQGTLPTVSFTSPSPHPPAANIVLPYRPPVRAEARAAITYDIVPTIAAPHSTSINTVTATPDMRWVFTGGADGYIRKFNWPDTANGKLALTVAQKHPFVDSVTKAGVLLSYWENEEDIMRTPNRHHDDGPVLSPVYSLAVHNQALWLLSGLESGGINLQSVRHSEGTKITTLRKHTSAVSVLQISPDERSVLSGSWDKSIHDWDLDRGEVRRSYGLSGSQISAIEPRPQSSLPVPEESGELVITNGTFSSNNAAPPPTNGVLFNGLDDKPNISQMENGTGNEDAPGEPDDDLNSLFGDDDAGPPTANGEMQADTDAPSMPGLADDEDDEFSRAMANAMREQDDDAAGDIDMTDVGGPVQPPEPQPSSTAATTQASAEAVANGVASSEPQLNGLNPHSDEPHMPTANGIVDGTHATPASTTTFLDASIDGMIRIWDSRMPSPIARMPPPRNTPPFCMSACWSPDGNFIYAGRRNNTVDEYSLHKGLSAPQRTFRFPYGSGAVSSVRTMPNGRHLIW